MQNFTINTDVEISSRDIIDNLSFSEVLDIYEPDISDLLDGRSVEEVMEWALSERGFMEACIAHVVEDDDARAAVKKVLDGENKVPVIEFVVNEISGDYKMVVDGVATGSIIKLVGLGWVARIGTLHFECVNAADAKTILRVLALAPKEEKSLGDMVRDQ
jgi:hypothetical protein